MDTSKLEETLDSRGGDEAGTTGSRNELHKRLTVFTNCLKTDTYSDSDRATLAGLLSRQGVWFTEVGTPVATTDGQDGQLRDDDSSADGGSDFLGRLDPETNVALRIANDNDSLETSTLTGTSLLLHGLDLLDYNIWSGLGSDPQSNGSTL